MRDLCLTGPHKHLLPGLATLALLVGCDGGGGSTAPPSNEITQSGGSNDSSALPENSVSGVAANNNGNPSSMGLSTITASTALNSANTETDSIPGGAAQAVLVGQHYSFTPQAKALDGAQIFRIENKPSWTNFDPSSGQLSGTPTSADVGSYGGIAISVDGGSLFENLPPITITVQQTGERSFTVSWQAPTENSDGSPLKDLAGYRIYYGTSQNTISTNSIDITNVGTQVGTVEGLTSGTWYFQVTAYNSEQVESEASDIVTTKL